MAAEMNKIARQEDLREFFLKFAIVPNPGTPEDLAALTRKDFHRYGVLVRQVGLRME